LVDPIIAFKDPEVRKKLGVGEMAKAKTARKIKGALKNGLIAVFTIALAACGGSADTPVTPVTPVASEDPAPIGNEPGAPTPFIIATVPVPTYLNEELKAFDVLNAARDRCGFGKLAQDTKLDAMATNHVKWLVKNGTLGQLETNVPVDPKKNEVNYFTGETVEDRARVAGYTDYSMVTEANGDYVQVLGASIGISALLSAPYHALGLLRGYRDVGIGIGVIPFNKDDPSAAYNRKIVVTRGLLKKDAWQTAEANAVRTYPCEGSADVESALYGETPSPVPVRDLVAHPLGPSIAVVGNVGKQMKITSATMTGPGGAMVALRAASTRLTDPNPGYLLSNEAYVIADAPLAASTPYQVLIKGTNGATPFSQSFTFTTRSSGQSKL